MPETFPLTPDYIDEFNIEPDVEIIEYNNGREQRILLAPAKDGFKLSWSRMSSEDKNTLKNFYNARNGATEAFIFHDHHNAVNVPVRFDGGLKIQTNKVNDYDISVNIVKVIE